MPELQHGLAGAAAFPVLRPPFPQLESKEAADGLHRHPAGHSHQGVAARPRRPGQVLEDWAEPDADQLCEVGWLERRTVNDTDDVAYFWTREAETALDMNAYAAPIPRT
jgi:hypothetical protein